MYSKAMGMWLVVFLIGLAGCSNDADSAWHETDGSWPDIEDVGGLQDGAEDTSDVGLGGDTTDHDVAPPGPTKARSWVLGTSVDGRPIVAEEFGERGPILYVMSAIHGSERSAVTFGERFRVPLQGGLAERAGVRVFYLGAANPDGIAIRSRHNASNIDLNRNFPSDNFDPQGTGGDVPLSEPESVVIHDAVVALDPAAVITVHCCLDVIDWDGPGESLASKMATAAGFPAARVGSRPGSFGSFSGVDLQIPTITVEFTRDEHIDTGEQLDKVEAATELAMEWAVEEDAPVQDFSIYDALSPGDSDVYSAIGLGLSAGKLSIRSERLGGDPEHPVLVVAGIDASDRNTLYVAEHIRNSLLSNQSTRRVQTTIVTAINPDGILTQSSRNADDEDVATDFGPTAKTPEARALQDLITSNDFSLVIFVDADASGDRIESFGMSVEQVQVLTQTSLDVVEGDVQSLAEGSFIRYLHEQNVRVLRFGVTTKFAMGDSRDGKVFEDITVFSDAAKHLVERPVSP